jgi:hypothetical protein
MCDKLWQFKKGTTDRSICSASSGSVAITLCLTVEKLKWGWYGFCNFTIVWVRVLGRLPPSRFYDLQGNRKLLSYHFVAQGENNYFNSSRSQLAKDSGISQLNRYINVSHNFSNIKLACLIKK